MTGELSLKPSMGNVVPTLKGFNSPTTGLFEPKPGGNTMGFLNPFCTGIPPIAGAEYFLKTANPSFKSTPGFI